MHTPRVAILAAYWMHRDRMHLSTKRSKLKLSQSEHAQKIYDNAAAAFFEKKRKERRESSYSAKGELFFLFHGLVA